MEMDTNSNVDIRLRGRLNGNMFVNFHNIKTKVNKTRMIPPPIRGMIL
jgi:hypothetical protein